MSSTNNLGTGTEVVTTGYSNRTPSVNEIEKLTATREAAAAAAQLSPSDKAAANKKAAEKQARKDKATAAAAVKKSVEAAENKAAAATINAAKLATAAERIAERKAVRESIKTLPTINLPIVTETGKAAIETDGKQMFFALVLSSLFSSIGGLIDKAGSTDFYLYFCKVVCKLPAKGNGGARCKNLILAMLDAAFKSPCQEGQNFVLSLRTKYDFQVIDLKGNFVAKQSEILAAIDLHSKANNTMTRIEKVRVLQFGYNPERSQIIKDGRDIFKAFKVSKSEGFKLLNNFDGAEAQRFLNG